MKRRWLRNSLLLFLLLAAGIFLGEKAQSISDTYRVLPGTGLENTVTVKKGKKEGALVYIVAGIHGDESAGWMAA